MPGGEFHRGGGGWEHRCVHSWRALTPWRWTRPCRYVYAAKAEEWAAHMEGFLGTFTAASSNIRSRYHSAETYFGTIGSAARAATMLQVRRALHHDPR